MLGKFAVTAGSSLMYVYTSELYPTVLRNTGTGACSVLSRVGSSVAPFLFKLSQFSSAPPLPVYCCSIIPPDLLPLPLPLFQVPTSTTCPTSRLAPWQSARPSARSSCRRPSGNLFLRLLRRCQRGKGGLSRGFSEFVILLNKFKT